MFNINTAHIYFILRNCTYRSIIFSRHSKQLIKINCVVQRAGLIIFGCTTTAKLDTVGSSEYIGPTIWTGDPTPQLLQSRFSSYKFWLHFSNHTQYHLIDVTTTEFVECQISLLLQINFTQKKTLWKHRKKTLWKQSEKLLPRIWDVNMDTDNCQLTRSVIIPLKTAKIIV